MQGPDQIKWGLKKRDKDAESYPQGSDAAKIGIKKIYVEYEFSQNKLHIWPSVSGTNWKVGLVALYDLSQYFKDDKAITEKEVTKIMNDEIINGKPYWRHEVKLSKSPFTCEITNDFGGRAFMIVVVVTKPKAPMYYQAFAFGWNRLLPAVTFVMGIGTTFSIARFGDEYRILDKFYAIRLPSGYWVEAGDVDNAEKKLTDEDLKFIALLDYLSIVKQMWQAEEKIGKAYLDKIFDKMEKAGRLAEARIFNALLLPIYYYTWRTVQFLLPSPYQNYTEAGKQFEKFLDPNSDLPTKVAGFMGFLGYGMFTVLDFVPGSKVLKKADDLLKPKVLKKVEEVPEYTSKLLTTAEKNFDEAAERLGKAKGANPEHASTLDEALQRSERARQEGEKTRKMLTEGYSALGRDEQVRLFRIAEANEDLAEVIKFANRTGNPLSLKQICQLTKGWKSGRRRWKAFVDWLRIQRMRGKVVHEVRLSDDVNKLVDEGKSFTDVGHFNLGQDGFKAVTKKIAKGLQKVGGKGLSRTDIDKFREALQKAYKRLSENNPELRKYIEGIEFSGKSATGFSDKGIKYLNDIDCTIMPITPKGLADSNARKQYFRYLEQEFKELTGSSLKEKNIFVYPEWGNGAFNKADEGWPPKLRHVYEKVENKSIAPFVSDGTLGELKVRNPDVIARLPTKEEAEFFCEWALNEFRRTKNPKWIHKADRVLEAAGLAKYSKEDQKIIDKMREIYLRDPNEIRAGEELLVEEAETFLRKYAGDTDVALSPMRYIFVFKNKYEAKAAYAYVKTLQKVQRLIRILYVQKEPEKPNRPPMKTVKLYQET